MGTVALFVGVAVLGIGWYYSDQIEDGGLRVKHDPPEYEIEVVALGEGRVTLRFPAGADPAKEPRILGVEWPGGYGRVSETLEIDGDTVIREYAPFEGVLNVGDQVRLDSFAFPGDPERAHGISFQEVSFSSPLGELDAWYVDGVDDTWVIFVHGRGAKRGEALRALPAAVDAGLPVLVITYRNDERAPEDPSGFYRYGLTEWEDLHAAASYALANGANDLVVFGYSMGGAVVASFLYESPLASRVSGVILDAPMLDFGATVDLAAQQRGLPGFLTATAKWIVSIRFDIDWGALDYPSRADEISAPVLLFHGCKDETVPVWVSEVLSEMRPDLVTYVLAPEAPHVGSWNQDPAKYEASVREFLVAAAR